MTKSRISPNGRDFDVCEVCEEQIAWTYNYGWIHSDPDYDNDEEGTAHDPSPLTDSITCANCGNGIHPLAVFPNREGEGSLCIDCYAKTPEGRRMPTAEEVTRLWGGKTR